MPRFLLIAGLAGSLFAQAPAPLNLTLQDALERARAVSPQILSANIAALLAHEDAVQAKAGLLPTANGLSQYIYTQPNGTPSGVFVSNDGPHVYNDQLVVHGDLFAPSKLADYHRLQVAEAVARAKADIAARGLIAIVVQDYYGMVSAVRKLANAQQSQREASDFAAITEKLERGGEVAHFDTVKAQFQLAQRKRETEEAQLAVDKARLAFAVLLFTDFRQDYTVTDDLDAARTLPPFTEIQTMAGTNNPDIRAAQATVRQQGFEIKSARAGVLPTVSFDYFWGINANQFAIHNREGLMNLGSVAQAQLTIPLWTWGATKSKVKQAELRLQQAKNDLSMTQRQLLSNLNSFYREAEVAGSEVASLRQSVDQAAEILRLTVQRYQAGEGSVLEVVDAQTALVQARNAYDDGMVRYRLALANLQTVTGAF